MHTRLVTYISSGFGESARTCGSFYRYEDGTSLTIHAKYLTRHDVVEKKSCAKLCLLNDPCTLYNIQPGKIKDQLKVYCMDRPTLFQNSDDTYCGQLWV